MSNLLADNERLRDLVRYARHYLHDAECITNEEYAALVADSDSGQRVARLEGYDAMRRENERLRAEVKRWYDGVGQVGDVGITWMERAKALEETIHELQRDHERLRAALRKISTWRTYEEGALPVTPSELREIAREALNAKG